MGLPGPQGERGYAGNKGEKGLHGAKGDKGERVSLKYSPNKTFLLSYKITVPKQILSDLIL